MTVYNGAKRIEKLSKNELFDITFDLINAFRLVKSPIETAQLLQDLLTVKEIKNLSKRLRIAKLLISGKTQKQIVIELHCSYATVTKVSIWLNQGGEGLRQIISKLPGKYQKPKNLPRRPLEFQLPQLLLTVAQESLYQNQQRKIQDVRKLYENLNNKRVIDKALKDMFDKDFRKLNHRKKQAEFRKKIGSSQK